MKFKEIAQGFIRQAELRVETAENAFNKEEMAYAVRQAQESVELALKAALNWVHIEHPRFHDVSPILKEKKDAFPSWFRQKIEQFANTSRELARKREPAMYGVETRGLAADKLFTKEETREILQTATQVVRNVKKLVTSSPS